ncbi:MAG: class I SAM-dependent methyltransferase [Pseudomonadota bacterium]|nr:class I SAM-dependent methyltransferase [Pseudomonadota bacterium]
MTVLSVCSANYLDKAQALSNQLKLPLIESLPHKKAWDNQVVLSWITEKQPEKDEPAKLALLSADSGPVLVDFIGGKKNHRRQFGGGKGQPLARAIGIQQETPPTILDATAGMGGDAFVFASLGCQVLMVERSPIVAALLQDALNRAIEAEDLEPEVAEIVQRLSLVNADSADYLLTEKPDVDVIYMDPMYPEKKKKSAAVKKEMKALQVLVGPDMDSEKLLEAALKTAKQRVVVKRPAHAPTINGIQPNAEISSPNTRYDIYSIKALKAARLI